MTSETLLWSIFSMYRKRVSIFFVVISSIAKCTVFKFCSLNNTNGISIFHQIICVVFKKADEDGSYIDDSVSDFISTSFRCLNF